MTRRQPTVRRSVLRPSGATVLLVKHDSAAAASDWIVDIGPGAGNEGGRVVIAGTPREVAASVNSRTAKYLAAAM